jgi:hypothetical protein
MALKNARFLERIRFFDRQRLLAGDLQTLESFHREMRWLHNQSLHQPGIGSGYAISGKKGDREVLVTPGYALDADGREIILTSRHTEPIPPVAGGGDGKPALYDLAVSYPGDVELKESERREGSCDSRGAVRLREEPVFCWIRLTDDGREAVEADLKTRVHDGMLIVLGRVEIDNCQLKQPVSITQRRNARPPKQPRIACGVARPAWKKLAQGQGFRAWRADVDTRSGSFASIPSYTARVRAEKTEAQWKLLASGVDIVDPLPTGFTIRLFISSFANGSLPDEVVWMGVEA